MTHDPEFDRGVEDGKNGNIIEDMGTLICGMVPGVSLSYTAGYEKGMNARDYSSKPSSGGNEGSSENNSSIGSGGSGGWGGSSSSSIGEGIGECFAGLAGCLFIFVGGFLLLAGLGGAVKYAFYKGNQYSAAKKLEQQVESPKYHRRSAAEYDFRKNSYSMPSKLDNFETSFDEDSNFEFDEPEYYDVVRPVPFNGLKKISDTDHFKFSGSNQRYTRKLISGNGEAVYIRVLSKDNSACNKYICPDCDCKSASLKPNLPQRKTNNSYPVKSHAIKSYKGTTYRYDPITHRSFNAGLSVPIKHTPYSR